MNVAQSSVFLESKETIRIQQNKTLKTTHRDSQSHQNQHLLLWKDNLLSRMTNWYSENAAHRNSSNSMQFQLVLTKWKSFIVHTLPQIVHKTTNILQTNKEASSVGKFFAALWTGSIVSAFPKKRRQCHQVDFKVAKWNHSNRTYECTHLNEWVLLTTVTSTATMCSFHPLYVLGWSYMYICVLLHKLFEKKTKTEWLGTINNHIVMYFDDQIANGQGYKMRHTNLITQIDVIS